MSAPALSVRRLTRRSANKLLLDGVSFEVAAGELLAVLGPSGAGKTTLLRLLAGLEAPDDGEIELDGRRASAAGDVFLPPGGRGVGFVQQNLALWPHLSVAEHLAFPLRMAGQDARQAREGALAVARAVGLEPFLERKPGYLSGGERQRVALGRALAGRPRLLLLDEPVSSLDPHLRESVRAEITAQQKRLGVAAVYVTHDRAEALELADRVLLLDEGRLVQLDVPSALYERPATPFAARFLGGVNELRGRRDGGRVALEGGLTLEAPGPDGEVVVFLRPEDLEARPEGDAGWPAVVESAAYRGESFLLTARCGGRLLKAASPSAPVSAKISLCVKSGRAKVYPL